MNGPRMGCHVLQRFTKETGQKVLVLSAPLVLQLYSAGNILTQVVDALVLISLDMFRVSFVRKRAFAETRRVKAIAGQLVTITVGFSFDGRLQQPRLIDISLAPVIS